MNNMPEVKVGIVAVSRDCFPESLSVNRRKALVEAYAKKYDAKDIYECPICIVESEIHMVQALEDIKKAGCNALCVYLGNFGPEISETLLAKHFDGPKMFIAAAEESQNDLCQGRGDAYCGMLNASYNQMCIRDRYVTIETSHFRNSEYTNCSKGTSCNRKNLAVCNVSTKLVISCALQTIECDISRFDISLQSSVCNFDRKRSCHDHLIFHLAEGKFAGSSISTME